MTSYFLYSRREFIALLGAIGASRYVEVPPAEAQQRARTSSVETTMIEVKHRIVETNGIHMHLAEQGMGPLASRYVSWLS